MSEQTILIAEDDEDIVSILRLYLENAGYSVASCYNGVEALEAVRSQKIDLCLFDIMMPKMNGYDLIREVRKTFNMPIIIISAKDKDSDKILGLDLGADDYILKPFNPLEVVARVRAGLRRFYSLNPAASDGDSAVLQSGDLSVDTNRMILYKRGLEIKVTPTEIKLLILLMRNPGRVYTKAQIYENLSGESYFSDDNTIMVHISNLRNKIEDDPRNPRYLITVRGLGYKFGN
ncbi:MAG: response regulator transcription factor [Lachnospiraceae bacterium]|nr:response regulator transcription factor [Lachnospiraceae bacterium]